MAGSEPLYLGFDLSTQQLKGIVVTPDLRVAYQAKFDFDKDSQGYDIHKGVVTNEELHEVYAPVALWLQALDTLLSSLQQQNLDFSRIRGISGACQQHGSVFWSYKGEEALEHLDATKKLEEQLGHAFSHPFAPNWQDASTQTECDEFDVALGSPEALAEATGSKAHHRFTGPQIMRFRKRHPEEYKNTARISLVSSFLASILLGKIASIDIGDVGGMNLWHIKEGKWHDKLLELTSGGDPKDLLAKLGNVPESGGDSFGSVAPYFVKRFGFNANCKIIPFTGDNPSTILALPLRPLDAIVSLGTSTTFLMSTPQYIPDPAVHFMNHPTTAGLYMFMLCYKNGGLAREKIRDTINKDDSNEWDKFDKAALGTAAAGQRQSTDAMKLGLYFPRHEIVPNLRPGTWRYAYHPESGDLKGGESEQGWTAEDDARAIVESQMLSLRLRSSELVKGLDADSSKLPPQPRRIYLVGGGSRNAAIAKIAGEVLGGVEGVYKLDVGENACALGAAYKAVWACERQEGETFEDLIGARWREEEFAEKLAEGYQSEVFEQYGTAVKGFDTMEKKVLAEEKGQ